MSVPNSQMQADFSRQNRQADPNTVFAKYYFGYSFVIASINSGATGSVNTQINGDADFLVQSLTFAVFDTTTNALVASPYSTIQITESNGVTFWDQAQPLVNVAGTGQLQFILPEARLLSKNNNIQATIVNVSSTNAQKYYVTMNGKKLFRNT